MTVIFYCNNCYYRKFITYEGNGDSYAERNIRNGKNFSVKATLFLLN